MNSVTAPISARLARVRDRRQRERAPSSGARAAPAPQLGSSSRSSASSARAATRQPRRLRRAPQGRRAPLHRGRVVLVPRRGRRTTTAGTASGRSAASADTSAYQGLRFLVVSLVGLGANLAVLLRARRGSAREARRPGGRDRARDAAELPRQQALVVPARSDACAGARLARRRSRCSARGRGPRRRPRPRPVYDAQGAHRDAVHAARPAAPQLTEARRPRLFLAMPKVAHWLDALPDRRASSRGDVRRARPRLDGRRLVGPGRARSRAGESTTSTGSRRPRPGPARRSPGRWRAADGGAFGGKRSTAARSGSASARSSCSGSPTCGGRCAAEPRPRRAALVLGLALVLQPRPHLHERAARLPAPPLSARAHALDRRPRPAAAALAAALAGLAARGGDGLPRRLPGRPERAATRT